MNPFITTYTGKKVNPLMLQLEDVCIEDIAHSLACVNRFNGHVRVPISVAQHSVWVSKLSGPFGMEGLLHDAAEAYLGDMTKWVKEAPGMHGHVAIERRAQDVICSMFGIPPEMPEIVKWADKLTVRFEHEVGFGYPSSVPGYGILTRPERARMVGWGPMSWQEAESAFLLQYQDLNR